MRRNREAPNDPIDEPPLLVKLNDMVSAEDKRQLRNNGPFLSPRWEMSLANYIDVCHACLAGSGLGYTGRPRFSRPIILGLAVTIVDEVDALRLVPPDDPTDGLPLKGTDDQ